MTASVLSTTTTTTTAPTLEDGSTRPLLRARVEAALAVAFGVALTLAMQGYQFGRSNHTVYLIDALRHASPHLLRNDWFATQTLHYHAAFGLLTRGLMKLGIIEPAFFIGHLALAVLLHVAWWRIVRALNGGTAAFVVSQILFHVSAAGAGLGMYQFLQDGAFLPSNIASVAMLWGIALWLSGRRAWSAVLFGVSGLFHLNYALVAPALWVLLAAISWWRDGRRPTALEWLGAVAMLELCLMNIAPAAIVIARRGTRMPLAEFIDLYVHLRHPHHYAPLEWPAWLWMSFLWPLPLAWLCFRTAGAAGRFKPIVGGPRPTQEASRVVAVILLLLVIAFFGAGVWYVSETLVQLSLWRFSVFVKLLTCVAAAMWIATQARRPWLPAAGSVVIGLAMIGACLARGPYFGLFSLVTDDPAYRAACDWIRANTPADAVFLVPPDEQDFRLRAQRAIVVNYKCVPQLSSELPAWRERLDQVLMTDIRALPTPFPATLAAIRHRYENLPPAHYANVAKRYDARFILVGHQLGAEWEPQRVTAMNDATPAYFLYDLQR
jgi:hypothetical protein